MHLHTIDVGLAVDSSFVHAPCIMIIMLLFMDQDHGVFNTIEVAPAGGLVLGFLVVDLVLHTNPEEVVAATEVVSDVRNNVRNNVRNDEGMIERKIK